MDYVKALYFIRAAFGMINDDCPRMLARSDWNVAGRHAYDAMEKVALAVETLSGIKAPRKKGSHSLRIVDDALTLIPLVCWRIQDDPSSGVSYCVLKRTDPHNHIRLMKCAGGTMTNLDGRAVASLDNMSLVRDGSNLGVFSHGRPVTIVTDTSGTLLDGVWVQLLISKPQLDILNSYLEPIPVARNTAAYYAKMFTRNEATNICDDAYKLFTPIKQRIGHNIFSPF